MIFFPGLGQYVCQWMRMAEDEVLLDFPMDFYGGLGYFDRRIVEQVIEEGRQQADKAS